MRRIFGPRKEEITGEWKDYIMTNFIIYTLYLILNRVVKSRWMI
jgi:hypothetical protein